ncbi:TIR domain-containing protein [Pseudomonas sp. LG1E9]|uniref:TIR domain-containing protein n=1 Tax=Pseudomonas sp. LG1E9 TaxID=2219057 RepID=UPI000DD4CA30|nr:TIR domain-containing protein [Pseudomonas sp. LG1E9]
MAILTEAEVIARSRTVSRSTKLIKSSNEAYASSETFDVFLSHSSNEPSEIIFGIKGLLEDAQLKVYLDKVDDPQMSPAHVTPETAEILRVRMRQSRSLLYVYSRHSTQSRWMPWELGFFDGVKGTVGILPVVQHTQNIFKGEEYLGVYPYVDFVGVANSSDKKLWINSSVNEYADLARWVKGFERIRKR